MTFRIIEMMDWLIEVEQVESGHRMTFCLEDDRRDISRGSFHESAGAQGKITKDCWRGAYLHAKRALMTAGLMRIVPGDPCEGMRTTGVDVEADKSRWTAPHHAKGERSSRGSQPPPGSMTGERKKTADE